MAARQISGVFFQHGVVALGHALNEFVGPGGLVSMEDGVIGHFVQKGIKGDLDHSAVIEMGGRGVGAQPTRVTETSVRGFWKVYRELMNI